MWAFRLHDVLAQGPCALVTVAEIHGSAPRALGSRMLVTPKGIEGSIGGGNLEFEAIETARRLLKNSVPGAQDQAIYGLGPALNQCCGGAVTLLYEHVDPGDRKWLGRLVEALNERHSLVLVTAVDSKNVRRWLLEPGVPVPAGFPATVSHYLQTITAASSPLPRLIECDKQRFLVENIQRPYLPLFLFGAGHVGNAVARSLRGLPFEITWIDSRPGQFPVLEQERLHMCHSSDPAAEVGACPLGGVYIVMTHSHQLDEDLCFEVFKRGDFAWLGLIGSVTKRRRFVHRLEQRGIEAAALERLVCPIGASGITGKRPATIAVALAAQLLQEVVPEPWR